MRLLLEAFRLPGEAQPIARITETFADIYFASKPRKPVTFMYAIIWLTKYLSS